jgi:hypothetical protein
MRKELSRSSSSLRSLSGSPSNPPCWRRDDPCKPGQVRIGVAAMARVRSLEGREAGILARIIQGVSLLALGRSLNPIKVQARAPRAMLSSRVEYWGFLALAAMMPFLLWRLLNEERILTRELPGYAEYRQRVRHRLVPMVW